MPHGRCDDCPTTTHVQPASTHTFFPARSHHGVSTVQLDAGTLCGSPSGKLPSSTTSPTPVPLPDGVACAAAIPAVAGKLCLWMRLPPVLLLFILWTTVQICYICFQTQTQLPSQAPSAETAVHVRGGTTYFNPQVQPSSTSRSPVRRVKVAIPIVNPQVLLTSSMHSKIKRQIGNKPSPKDSTREAKFDLEQVGGGGCLA